MPATVTGSPLAAFADAIYQRLSANTALAALAKGGVFAALPESHRVDPLVGAYVVVGHRTLGPRSGAMQREGGNADVLVDVWSGYNGPAEAQDIQAQIRRLLQRYDLAVAGFSLYSGSVTCTEEMCYPDWDPDMPERTLFHGVQRWVGLLEELL